MPDQPKFQETEGTALDITIAVLIIIVAAGFFAVFSGQVKDFFSGIAGWMFSGGLRESFTGAAVIFVILDIILFAFIIFTMYLLSTLDQRVPEDQPTEARTVEPKEEISKEWGHIRELANSVNQSDWNMAIIRADALLDDALQHLGYEGTTVAERLKIVDPTKLKSLDRVWSAHRLRNAIAHDPLEQHTKDTIIYALRSYQEALKDFGFME